MTTVLRARLGVSALAAASSLIAISAPLHAQSVCSVTTPTTFDCTNGSVTGAIDAVGGAIVVIPQGLSITDTGALTATVGGTLNTTGATPAATIVSVGDLGLAAAGNGLLNVVQTGSGTGVTLSATAGAINAAIGSSSTTSGPALLATGATGATIGATTLTTTGGIGADVLATTGGAQFTLANNVAVNGGPLGVRVRAPAGLGVATIGGNVNVTGSTGATVGVVTQGLAATSSVAGTTTVTGSGGSGAGIVTLASAGTSTTSCGNVVTSGAGVLGVVGVGTDVVIRCGNVTTNGNNAIGIGANAANSIDAVVGNVTTNGAGALGVQLTAPGAIAVRTGNISTIGADAVGLRADGATGNVGITTGTVTTNGTAAHGIVATTTTGNIAINSGKVTANGAGSYGIGTQSTTGDQTITVAGVQSNLDGVFATALNGGGDITVNATGPAVSTAGYGINVHGTDGTLNVTAIGASGALGGINVVDSGVGTVRVTAAAGGLITSPTADAIRLETLGNAITTVNQGADVNGQYAFDAIDTRGALGNTVNVNGILGMAPNGAGYAINASGGATTIVVGGTGSLFGRLLLTGNNDVLTNNGTLNLTSSSDFGAGSDLLTNNFSTIVAAGATVTGLETLNNSAGATLALGAGSAFTGMTSLTNGGTVNVGGNTVLGTTFTNNATGAVIATNGGATLGGVATFNNAGLITMVDGAANDTLTIPGNYNGSGSATLAVDVDGNLNAADKLVVGGNITGTTVIDLNLVGSTPLYNPTGVVVVDGGGTVAAGAFVLAPADVQQGFLNFGLRQVGNDMLVASTLDRSVTDLALVGSLGQELWYQSFDAYHDAIMGRHAGSLTTGHPIGIWGQLYESKDRYGDDSHTVTVGGQSVTYSDKLRTHRRGAQVGLEYRGPGWVIGATGGYEWARSEDQPSAAQVQGDGHNYGAYALFGMSSGLYGGLMYKRDDYKVRFANGARLVNFRNSAHSEGVDGELGFKSAAGGAMVFDLNAGLSYVKSNIDPWNQYGLTFDWRNNKSMRGRLGARVILPAAWGAFVGAKVMHEFKDDGFLAISNTAAVANIEMPHRGTWVRLEGGLNGMGTNGALLTVWGDLGNTKAFGARVGFRF